MAGVAAAFVPDPDLDPAIADDVAMFVPRATGQNSRPHVTVGVVANAEGKCLTAEPYHPDMAEVAGVALSEFAVFAASARRPWGWPRR